MIGTGKLELHSARRGGRFNRVSLVAAFLGLFWSLPSLGADPATITFSLDFPKSNPERYSIAVQSDGRAHYECSGKISDDSEDRETYETEFTFSDVA